MKKKANLASSYTERQTKFITSSEWYWIKFDTSNFVICSCIIAKILLITYIGTDIKVSTEDVDHEDI